MNSSNVRVECPMVNTVAAASFSPLKVNPQILLIFGGLTIRIDQDFLFATCF